MAVGNEDVPLKHSLHEMRVTSVLCECHTRTGVQERKIIITMHGSGLNFLNGEGKWERPGMSVLGVSWSEQRFSLVYETPAFTPLLGLFFNHKKYIFHDTQGDQKYSGSTPEIQRTQGFSQGKKKIKFICSYGYKARLRMSLGIGHCPSGEVFPQPVGRLRGTRTG